MSALTTIPLRQQRDSDGLRRLDASRRPDGGIVLEGHDLGPGVERLWGEGLTEYEWAWSLEADAVPAAVAALGGADGDDPLRVIGTWYDANGGLDPGIRLREAGVAVEFWSRVGD